MRSLRRAGIGTQNVSKNFLARTLFNLHYNAYVFTSFSFKKTFYSQSTYLIPKMRLNLYFTRYLTTGENHDRDLKSAKIPEQTVLNKTTKPHEKFIKIAEHMEATGKEMHSMAELMKVVGGGFKESADILKDLDVSMEGTRNSFKELDKQIKDSIKQMRDEVKNLQDETITGMKGDIKLMKENTNDLNTQVIPNLKKEIESTINSSKQQIASLKSRAWWQVGGALIAGVFILILLYLVEQKLEKLKDDLKNVENDFVKRTNALKQEIEDDVKEKLFQKNIIAEIKEIASEEVKEEAKVLKKEYAKIKEETEAIDARCKQIKIELIKANDAMTSLEATHDRSSGNGAGGNNSFFGTAANSRKKIVDKIGDEIYRIERKYNRSFCHGGLLCSWFSRGPSHGAKILALVDLQREIQKLPAEIERDKIPSYLSAEVKEKFKEAYSSYPEKEDNEFRVGFLNGNL